MTGRLRSGPRALAAFIGRLVGLGAGVAVVAASFSVPPPRVLAAPRSLSINPTGGVAQLVCPGPVLLPGVDPSHATTNASLAPSVVVGTGTMREALNTDNPSAGRDGSPSRVTDPSPHAQLAAAEITDLATEGYRGLSAGACFAPTVDAWLVGASSALGDTAVLQLASPTTAASVVTLTVWGSAGKIDASLPPVRVPAGSAVSLSLAGIAPNQDALALHVHADGGPITAWVSVSEISGLTPQGIDQVAPGAAPSTALAIAGLIVDASTATATAGEAGQSGPKLRLLAPEAEASVQITVRSESGLSSSHFEATLSAGAVTELTLGGLSPGSYAVSMTASAPVVAAAWSALTDGAARDYAWTAASEALGDQAQVVIPDHLTAQLHVLNTDQSVRTLAISGRTPTTLTLQPGQAQSVPLESGGWALSGSAGMVASVSLLRPAGMASYPVLGPSAAQGTVTVYPR